MSDTTTGARIDRLRSVPIFAELPEDTLQRLLACATEFEAPPGQVLAETNMAGSGLFVVEEGTVTVEVPGQHHDLGPGEFFGELALLTTHTRAARVRTKTTARCLAIARHDFEGFLEAEPTLAIAMLRVLANRIAEGTPH